MNRRLALAVALAAVVLLVTIPTVAAAVNYDCFTFTSWTPRGDAPLSGKTVVSGKVWAGSGEETPPKTVKLTFSNRSTRYYFTTSGNPDRAVKVTRNKFFWYMRQSKYKSRPASVDWHWKTTSGGTKYRYVDKVKGGIVGG